MASEDKPASARDAAQEKAAPAAAALALPKASFLGRPHQRMLHRGGYFSPNGYQATAIVLLAVTIGLAVYCWFVRGTYIHLYDAYREAEIATEILSQDPAFPPPPPGERIPPQEDAERLFRALQLLRLVSEEDTLEAVRAPDSKLPAKLIFDAMPYGDGAAELAEGGFSTSPAADLMVRLAFRMKARAGLAQEPEAAKDFADLLAAALANQPGVAEELRRQRDLLGQPGATLPPGKLMRRFGRNLGWRDAFVFTDEPPPLTNLEVVNLLYRVAGVDEAYDPRRKGELATPEAQAQLKAMTRFLEAIVERMRGDAHVKKAAKAIPLWKGYEQAAMWVVFFWMLLLLGFRETRRWRAWPHFRNTVENLRGQLGAYLVGGEGIALHDPARALRVAEAFRQRYRDRLAEIRGDAQHDPYPLKLFVQRVRLVAANYVLSGVDSASAGAGLRAVCREIRHREAANRWFIRYLAFALPAIGFIGTKRGIAGALSQADLIVRAQDPGAQAAAISTVTGILGIAFTTTLIALVMGLVINLANAFQMHREAALVDELEEALGPLVEPERTLVAKVTPPPAAPVVPSAGGVAAPGAGVRA